MPFGDLSPPLADSWELTLPRGTFVLPTDDEDLPFAYSLIRNLSPSTLVFYIVGALVVLAIIIITTVCIKKSRKFRQSVSFVETPSDLGVEDSQHPADYRVIKGLPLFQRNGPASGDTNTSTGASWFSTHFGRGSMCGRVFCCHRPNQPSYEGVNETNTSGCSSVEMNDHGEHSNAGSQHDNSPSGQLVDQANFWSVCCSTEVNGVQHSRLEIVCETSDEELQVTTGVPIQCNEILMPKLMMESPLYVEPTINTLEPVKEQENENGSSPVSEVVKAPQSETHSGMAVSSCSEKSDLISVGENVSSDSNKNTEQNSHEDEDHCVDSPDE